MKILLTISYDGSSYYGWLKQATVISVQEQLEIALSALYKQDISIRGASKTDAGVHAMAQIAVYTTNISIPLANLPKAINSFLPDDIVVTKATEVNDSFHPQYNVINKTYEYLILNDEFRNPKLVKYTDFVRNKLDISKMQEACQYFIGEHDFKAFCASGTRAKSTIRQIYSLCVAKNNNIVSIKVTGNGFLYNMVRIIAGTLVDIGAGKILPTDIPIIINAKNRTKAGKTLAPNGLTLMEVNYEE